MSLKIQSLNVSDIIDGNAIPVRKIVDVATIASGNINLSFQDGSTVDGIILSTNDRILLKNQGDGTENGIYNVQSTGVPIRSDDFLENTLVGSICIFVNKGTINKSTMWMCDNSLNLSVVGTDSLIFNKISAPNVPISTNLNSIVKWGSVNGDILLDSNNYIDDSDNLLLGNYLRFSDITEPSYSGDGYGNLYKLENDDGIWWKADSSGSIINLARPSTNYNHKKINIASYAVQFEDDILGVMYTITGETIITLPIISNIGKKMFIITDEGGNSQKNSIIIQRGGSDLINGDTSIEINRNYNSLTFYNDDTTNWYLQ